ncbi:MAG: efflux RND transporter periplasmic adaptor subunit [Vicinamibacteraceae bacterium]|nr:efflux RND transporter periplasmic adaptor subunit [Vicinamibacteraceae bacterium]
MSELRQQLEALRLDEDEGPPRRTAWWGVLALVLVAAVAVVAWRALAGPGAPDVAVVQASVRAPVANGGAPMLTVSGYVVARRKAVVSAKIQGRLSELRVEEGSRVREGEVIARLESADYEAALGRARARVESIRAQMQSADARVERALADLAENERQERQAARLVDERVVATDTLEVARSRVAIARAAVSQARAERAQMDAELIQSQADVRFAEAQLQNTVIRAPFDGTVVRKMAEVGESVAPIPPGVNISTSSGAVVALADLQTLEAEVDVAEANVARLRDEQPAEVVVEAFPDRRYRAVLRQVIPTADRTQATVMVKVTILDRDELLKPEMSARVTFLEHIAEGKTDATPVVLAPQSAIVTRAGQTSVFVVEGEMVRARRVEVGSAQQGQAVIKSGLAGRETLVDRPDATLADGMRVRVRK